MSEAFAKHSTHSISTGSNGSAASASAVFAVAIRRLASESIHTCTLYLRVTNRLYCTFGMLRIYPWEGLRWRPVRLCTRLRTLLVGPICRLDPKSLQFKCPVHLFCTLFIRTLTQVFRILYFTQYCTYS